MSVQALVNCINSFASQNSNPVMSVLPGDGVVKFNRKYPEPMLSFSNLGLRAYYHCHSPSSQQNIEHGHFHLFIRSEEAQWGHMTSLSMDNFGQPLQWFTVNHWVTGETWLNASQLVDGLDKLFSEIPQDLKLVEEWLLAMLRFYKPDLKALLLKRDQQIEELSKKLDIDTLLHDRSIYFLSQRDICLLKDLTSSIDPNSIQTNNLPHEGS